jgi:Domain of Unknown Function (DUF1080)
MMCNGFVSRLAVSTVFAALSIALANMVQAQEYKSGRVWPEPKVVDAGPPGGVPADAIVLFDGKDMSAWKGADDWPIKDGVVTVKRGPKSNLGYAETKQPFGDCQIHLEFCEPEVVRGSGQGRGNSGVYIMGRYEVQILDSVNNPTYYDGQCGAIYKQHPPLVNVSRKPGEWQTYDIVWEAPKFEDGKVVKPAFITVLQNGVVVQAHFQLEGGTFYDRPVHYEPHAAKEPLRLQDHGNPVQFRNIWIRELTPVNYSMEGKPAYQ